MKNLIIILMDNRQMLYVLGISMISNVIANILIQNNLITLLILIMALIISFYIGLFVESKFNVVNKIKNFDIEKINSLLSDDKDNNSN
tara:strand:+ start:528 stop:791 length:264 start_codon:yes stop_codon:yes gene_type:complete